MTTLTASPGATGIRREGAWHRRRVAILALAAAALIVYLGVHGYSYYRLSLEDRPLSPLHGELRPSGGIGLKLGMLGVILYAILFLFPLRKRLKWMAALGSTRHWLDIHVVVGIATPILITFHAAFKFQGVAGVAYWIMMAVALSGFIGRYVYAQIPRSLNSVQLTMSELQTQSERLAASLSDQKLFQPEELAPLLSFPSPLEICKASLWGTLWTMLKMDIARPFQVSRLRRRVLDGFELLTTLGGFLASSHADLESIISVVRRQSWLGARTAFLERSQQVFDLWHVIHRPFSFSFAALVLVHIGVVVMLGYF
jgi:hypothetical protein